ncbi:hypothetical protein CXB74_011915 [Morganella morganii]|uniref:hypothetical protein n=1 Tax=Morganella morganii TaxID=582 RepID=UPI001C76357B|nr:hypothetical protein [Morganella morganii]QXO41377.1 hypothetical protein CXB74_011915 [Morganella morganii]
MDVFTATFRFARCPRSRAPFYQRFFFFRPACAKRWRLLSLLLSFFFCCLSDPG